MANLNHKLGRGTVANVLKTNGIELAPERGKHARWSTFLKGHWRILTACDFSSVEVWTPRGLLTYYVLFVISIAERVVHIAGMTSRPDEAWMPQIGRSLFDEAHGMLAGKNFLVSDHDTKYSQRLRELVVEGGAEVMRIAHLSPNPIALAERFLRSIKKSAWEG